MCEKKAATENCGDVIDKQHACISLNSLTYSYPCSCGMLPDELCQKGFRTAFHKVHFLPFTVIALKYLTVSSALWSSSRFVHMLWYNYLPCRAIKELPEWVMRVSRPDLLGSVNTGENSSEYEQMPETSVEESEENNAVQVQNHVDRSLLRERHQRSTSMAPKRFCCACFIQCMRRGKTCGGASSCQHTCSQCPEHLTVPDSGEYRCAHGANSLLTKPGCVWLFSLFPKLKGVIKGSHFEDMSELNMASRMIRESAKNIPPWRHYREAREAH